MCGFVLLVLKEQSECKVICALSGCHAAEPRQGDDDCHQWCCGIWKTETEA